jgi:hypothetical protein
MLPLLLISAPTATAVVVGQPPPPPWPGPIPKGGWALWPAALPKLKLGPEHCTDMFGAGVGGGGHKGSRGLLDEQAAAGDPASGQGQLKPTSDFMPGWTPWQYPHLDPASNGGVQGLIDLGGTTALSDVWMNIMHGVTVQLALFADSPFDAKAVWQVMGNTTHTSAGIPSSPPTVCNGWGWSQRWCGWNISTSEAAAPKGRYLVVSMMQPSSLFEIVLYGSMQQGPPPPPPPPPSLLPFPLIGKFIGVNSFVTEPLARQNVAGWIREYLPAPHHCARSLAGLAEIVCVDCLRS